MMLKKIHKTLIIAFLTICKTIYAQVDVVYNDLVWSDEFNNNGAVDGTKWFHQTQLPTGTSWYNNELQHYTNLATNSFANNGSLNIVAKKETYTDQGVTKEYTSARLNSKFAFKYGRIDVYAKIPVDGGTWPAIWMLGKNVNEPGGYFASSYGNTNWPACGEIDIMEHGIFPSQSVNYVQSTLHTPSSSGNSVNNGGITASDLANNFHLYSMNWSPYQITFLLDGVAYYTYNPSVKNSSTWPFDKEQYLLLNIAMGGTAGTIPANFTQSSMIIDYVRIYQNTATDIQSPTNFTATVGAVTSSSVELLLNGTDNSGTLVYTISGATSQTFANPSGTQKSVVISGLNPNTTYNFSISASDMSGNTATNNPIILNATTAGTANTQCYGTSNEASQGSFITGYKYNFQTIGTDVKFTFELLDTDKVGVVAYLWKQTPFTETPMTNVSGNIFTQNITGQTLGSTITYAVKFAFAGGMSVTKYYSYVVGNSCSLATNEISQSEQAIYPNPVKDVLHLKLSDAENQILCIDASGRKVFEKTLKSSEDLDMSHLDAGTYFLSIKNRLGVQNFKIIKE